MTVRDILHHLEQVYGTAMSHEQLLWVAIINIDDKRARERAACRHETGKRADQPVRLIEGQRTMGWREALNELDTAYPGRIG